MAIFHKGMDVECVIVTDVDVWRLSVRGQIDNNTWANFACCWEAEDGISVSSPRKNLNLQ